MKILIANTLYDPIRVGGAEVSTQILAEGLAALGIEVCVVCATGTGGDRVAMVNGVKVYYLHLANLYWPYDQVKRSSASRMLWHAIDIHNVFMQPKLKRIVESERPDLVNTSNLSCLSIGLWKIAKDAGLKTIHTIRDYYLMCPASTMYANGQTCEKQCSRCTLYSAPKKEASRNVDVAVGVSRFVLEKHLQSGYFSKETLSTVIHDCYLPDTGATTELPRREPCAGGVVRLGILGRVSPEKGIELVLEQLKRESGFNWHLSIAGTGKPDYVDSLKAAGNDRRIEFIGQVDATAFLDTIDVLIVPSDWNEPFGRVTVEAYARGVAVVGSSSGAIPEVVEPGSALVFDRSRQGTLVEKIRQAIELVTQPDAPTRFVEYAQKFSPEAMVREYVDLYTATLTNVTNESATEAIS
jgi:glycosyltransferase involved in cell wall biosynthesis